MLKLVVTSVLKLTYCKSFSHLTLKVSPTERGADETTHTSSVRSTTMGAVD